MNSFVVMSKEVQASEEFDREGLVQGHNRFYNSLQKLEEPEDGLTVAFTIRTALPLVWRPAVPLTGLQPIGAKQLEIGKRHHGRVLYGTLCAEAHRIVDIMTVLEDQFGHGVRVAIYNISLSNSTTEDVRRFYPKGAKVAVKEPYLKRAQDGLLMLRVNNHETVEFVTSFEGNHAESSCVDLLQLRLKGNALFRNQDWKGAIEIYSKCIDLALSYQKPCPSKEVMGALLYSYSNMAEARLRLKEYGEAAEDCEQALQLDSLHLKTIFRKGRALHGVGEYKLACECFQLAIQQCPTADEIRAHYDKSKQLNQQNQQGKFDLSSYLLNGWRPEDVPELSNYIGPVIIRESVGRGRGLFAKKEVNVGDTLLAENAIVLSGICRSTVGHDLKYKSKMVSPGIKKDVVEELISCALSSPRILQQIECFAYLEGEGKVPDMDMFRINKGNWKKYDVCTIPENAQINEDRIRKAVELNQLLSHISDDEDVFTATENMWTGCRVDERWGFWALSSFINHSCFPNAKCMVVGKTMFVIAVRKIGQGEEITVSYFHSLLQLAKREMMCSKMGFRCDCKRCLFERSLPSAFTKIAQSLDYVLLAGRLLRIHHEQKRYIESLVDLALQLEKEFAAPENRITIEGKQLIRASFQTLYCTIFASAQLFPDNNVPSDLLSKNVQVAEAMQHALPGNPGSFQLFASFLDRADGRQRDVLLSRIMEVGITLIGKQEERVLKALQRTKPLIHTVFKA